MKSHRAWIVTTVSLCAALASCGNEIAVCNVAEECLTRCTEECAPEPLASFGCVGNACDCFCGSGGAGGDGGTGGEREG